MHAVGGLSNAPSARLPVRPSARVSKRSYEFYILGFNIMGLDLNCGPIVTS